jgi:PAS domain S-box-containing protein
VRKPVSHDRVEQDLRDTNVKLQQAGTAKDRFLASMSHELCTPLNEILGFTGTLLMGLPGPLNALQTKQLRTVQASSRHLLSLINDLLDLARIEAGELELNTLDGACVTRAVEDNEEQLRVLNAKLVQKVSELQAVNTELRQANDFRSVVMQNIAEGLYVTDAQDRLVFMNPAASRMLGYREEDLLEQPVHAAFHHQRADGSPLAEHDCQLKQVLTDGRPVRISDDAFTRSDGTILRVAGSAAPLLSGTTVRGSVVVFRDTTADYAEEIRVHRDLDELSWVGRLRDVLDEERLILFSQPIIALTARAEPSQELLVRIVGRAGEIIAPGQFLAVAEKYGQIREVDQWVMTQAARLTATGTHLHVNVSAVSVGSRDLLHRVEQVLSEAGANPANVVFEITETALMEDLAAGEAFARGITEIGCGLALDDFGTGYGSLTYLQKLPFTFLKIDIAFVRDLVTSAANHHVVKAIVNIAQGFGQQTIAEGVEDAETLELLRAYGVDLAQGFHLGRPQPLAV